MTNKNAAPSGAAPSSTDNTQAINGGRQNGQVDWWAVHQWVTPRLESAGNWPVVGSPAWVALDDDDPRKLAAALDAAQHWALRMDACQDALADASRAIAASADWAAVAREMVQRVAFINKNPWSARRPA